MNLEQQTVLDRLELVERQARTWKILVVLSILLSGAALTLPRLDPPPLPSPVPSHGRFAVVEANRFLLRDAEGTVAGGMEVLSDGGIKLVLGRGYGRMGAAFVEVQADGNSHLTLRGPDGDVRVALTGSETPFLVLSSPGDRSRASLVTRKDGSGALLLSDQRGRVRQRAP